MRKLREEEEVVVYITFPQIKDMVEITTDNEFDSDNDYLTLVNMVIIDINSKVGTKYRLITLANVSDSQDVTFLTDIPIAGIGAFIKGIQALLQRKETEDDWREYFTEYNAELERIRFILINQEDPTLDFNGSTGSFILPEGDE